MPYAVSAVPEMRPDYFRVTQVSCFPLLSSSITRVGVIDGSITLGLSIMAVGFFLRLIFREM